MKDGHRAWVELRAGFADERDELEQRKEGRLKRGFRGLTDVMRQGELIASVYRFAESA